MAPATALFHSLSDPTRLAIVQRLTRGEARVVDLMAELGLPQSTVSTHVACLRDCALVAGRPEGRQVFYRLARPELLDLLAAAETVLIGSGYAVALCPTYGPGTTGGLEETLPAGPVPGTRPASTAGTTGGAAAASTATTAMRP